MRGTSLVDLEANAVADLPGEGVFGLVGQHPAAIKEGVGVQMLGMDPSLQDAHEGYGNSLKLPELDDFTLEVLVFIELQHHQFQLHLHQQVCLLPEDDIVSDLNRLDADADAVFGDFEEVLLEDELLDGPIEVVAVLLAGDVDVLLGFIGDKHIKVIIK
jgi:hypothetical protein